jgi:hypothetical protein
VITATALRLESVALTGAGGIKGADAVITLRFGTGGELRNAHSQKKAVPELARVRVFS